MTVTDCTFKNNYGTVGGVFALYDYFTVTISDCIFYYNWAVSGGALYIS